MREAEQLVMRAGGAGPPRVVFARMGARRGLFHLARRERLWQWILRTKNGRRCSHYYIERHSLETGSTRRASCEDILPEFLRKHELERITEWIRAWGIENVSVILPFVHLTGTQERHGRNQATPRSQGGLARNLCQEMSGLDGAAPETHNLMPRAFVSP